MPPLRGNDLGATAVFREAAAVKGQCQFCAGTGTDGEYGRMKPDGQFEDCRFCEGTGIARCLECEAADAIHNDPRTPPLDPDPCLCAECFDWVCDDLVDELRQKIDEVEKQQLSARNPAQTDRNPLIESENQAQKRA